MRPPIKTARLLLRDVTEADAELLLELDSDPEVLRFIGPPPSSSSDWYQKRIHSVYLPWQAHAWHGIRIVEAHTADHEFLGFVFVRPAIEHWDASTLGWQPGQVELGYRFRRAAWGQGIATEAAQPLVALALADPETEAVVGCALASNLASLRVLEKLGLRQVGEAKVPGHSEPVIKLICLPENRSKPWENPDPS